MQQALTDDRTAQVHEKGPKIKDIEILVNHNKVVVAEKTLTGLEIKDAAIAQGVNIRRDFVLIQVLPNGKRDTIGDADPVKVHNGSEFEAIADDDNS
jgi:hypothetical protein